MAGAVFLLAAAGSVAAAANATKAMLQSSNAAKERCMLLALQRPMIRCREVGVGLRFSTAQTASQIPTEMSWRPQQSASSNAHPKGLDRSSLYCCTCNNQPHTTTCCAKQHPVLLTPPPALPAPFKLLPPPPLPLPWPALGTLAWILIRPTKHQPPQCCWCSQVASQRPGAQANLAPCAASAALLRPHPTCYCPQASKAREPSPASASASKHSSSSIPCTRLHLCTGTPQQKLLSRRQSKLLSRRQSPPPADSWQQSPRSCHTPGRPLCRHHAQNPGPATAQSQRHPPL